MTQAAPNPSPVTRLVSYSAGFASAMALIGTALALLQHFSNFKVVDVASYLSLQEVSADYYRKSFVEKHYIERLDVANNYVKKEDAATQLASRVAPEDLLANYVPKLQNQELQERYNELERSSSEIPYPFAGRRKMLSMTGEWNDSQLGLSISVKKPVYYSDETRGIQIALSLPDSPIHFETIQNTSLPRSKWTFMRNNREFELKVETFDPLVFFVKEITDNRNRTNGLKR